MKPQPTTEQIERQRAVRDLERQVKRILFPKRVPCRRYTVRRERCRLWIKLWIEKPTRRPCPTCRQKLDWERIG